MVKSTHATIARVLRVQTSLYLDMLWFRGNDAGTLQEHDVIVKVLRSGSTIPSFDCRLPVMKLARSGR